MIVARRILFTLILFYPAAQFLWIIHRYGVNVPFGDEWVFVPHVQKLFDGTLSLNDLIKQHNEHRIFFPRLVFLGLAWVTHWNIVAALYASWLFILLSLGLIWSLLKRTVPDKFLHRPLIVIEAFLLFSLAPANHLIWAWQLQWFLTGLFVVSCLCALSQLSGTWKGIVFAALAAFGATFSAGNGQAVWLVGSLSLYVQRSKWNRFQVLFWGISALASIALYFHEYTFHKTNVLEFIHRPYEFLAFLLAYLGNSFGIYGGIHASVVYAIVGILLAMFSVVYFFLYSKDLIPAMLPWIQLTIFGCMSAVITAVGRLNFGLEKAIAPHYAIMSGFFWMGLFVIAGVAITAFYRQGRRLQRAIISIVVLSGFLFFGWGYWNSCVKGYKAIQWFNNFLRVAQLHVYNYRLVDSSKLKSLFPRTDYVRECAASLEKLRMGPFVAGTSQEIRERMRQQSLKRQRARNERSYVVPGSSIYIPPKFEHGLIRGKKVTSFQVSEKSGIQFFIGSDSFPPQLKTPTVSRVVVIESRLASEATVHWESKDGVQAMTLAPLPFRRGWIFFQFELPGSANGFGLSLQYTADLPVRDSLKIRISGSTTEQ